MTRFMLVSFGLLFVASAAAMAELPARTSVLVISLPSTPHPPDRDRNAGHLFRGTWRWVDPKGHPAPIEPVKALSEAAMSCGQRRFDFRGLNYDHGNEMVLNNNWAARRALTCIAEKVSFDFYVRTEKGKGR